MKFITYLAVSSLMFTCLACGNGRPYEASGSSETTKAVTPASPAQAQATPVNLNTNNSQTTPATITPLETTAPGMNPPHGEPGHRCDIAVGAPLNSAPAQQTAAPATTPVNISATQPAITATVPGMNPPHGQPGHRCDIAVGAPLNSKPAQLPATNATTPINISADKVAQPVTTTKVAPGMNPPHGEPGHRCDIAVGAPLNSKPTIVTGVPSKEVVTSSSIPAVVPIKPATDSSKQKR